MKIPRTATLLLCGALIAVGAVGCTPSFPDIAVTLDPTDTSSPPTPSPSADGASAPTCENLWSPAHLERAAAAGYTLDPGYTGSSTEGFADLAPFVAQDGLVCIWGSPDHPELPSAYAWSPIDTATAAEIQASFDPERAIRTETASGVVYAFESMTDGGLMNGYLFRDGDWFYSTELEDLEPMAARFDAL